ncbi:MAG: arginase [Bacillota bacterium]|nr:arginase [Bacillota bacterium]
MFKYLDVIGVPVDFGANKRGVDMGPSAIRYSGLKNAVTEFGINYRDLGNLAVPMPKSDLENTDEKMKYLKEINKVNEALSKKVSKSLQEGNIPLVLGGDHSIAVGSVLGTQSALKNTGIIWMDAHGDFNTRETTLSGNLHGMSLAAVTGAGSGEMTGFKPEGINYVNPDKVAIIGVRCLDRDEAKLLHKSGVHIFTMEDIDMYGMREVMKKAIEIVEKDTKGFHLSFDIDVITPTEAPGVGTPVKGGLTYREAHLAVEMLSSRQKLRSLEFVELNPIMDNANVTGELAVSLICSVLGKKIFKIIP